MPPLRGNSVDYFPGESFNGQKTYGQPLVATIAHVHSPTSVNLAVLDERGHWYALSGVAFIAEDEDLPGVYGYACWPEAGRQIVKAAGAPSSAAEAGPPPGVEPAKSDTADLPL